MPESTVVIVGGGASGLSAAGALQRRGITAVVLEEDEVLGGTWARRYDRLHLHTVRGFSGLAHYPIPRRYPKYLSREEFVAYLSEYARHFDLRVVTGCPVQNVRIESDRPSSWVAATPRGDWHSRVIVIATGQYRIPIMPNWDGREKYRGSLVHSSSHTSAFPYAGKRVLVVGAGNSGTEIATDLAEHGAPHVALSIRTPPPIVPRDPFGMPVQRTGILLSFLPPAIADRLARLTARIVLGDLTRHGLPTPEWMPYSARRIPVIDVGFVNAMKQRLVQIRPALSRLTATDAVFEDGSAEPFDAIIAATGFSTGLSELLETKDVLNDSDEPIELSGQPTACPGIFFMGYTHSLRGHLFEANLASRRLAGNVERYLQRTM
ncbi:MAG TPA: NAD(P)/FAD-dependent oxidoreductase [Gemmatimonadaceae bacterium]|nr:NAD(P)/FAD-dependent oxidoreductase [Gemmatimonadaceae bacterium]